MSKCGDNPLWKKLLPSMRIYTAESKWEKSLTMNWMTKLCWFSSLDGLYEFYWSCLPSVRRHNPKETWLDFRGVCHLRCLPSTMSVTTFHLALLLIDPLSTFPVCWIWGFDVEIHSFKIHSNLLYKLTVVAMESQWWEALLTLLAFLSCLFFCLIQVWLFPYLWMEGNYH